MKIFYFDTETTGLQSYKHAIIQLAYIIEIDGAAKECGNLLIQPYPYDVIEMAALAINRRSLSEIFVPPFITPQEAYKQLISVLDKYVDKYDSQDKFYPAGYNVSFDCDFLAAFFRKNNNTFFASYFHFLKIDPSSALLLLGKPELPNYKLATVCRHYGIEINAHDALGDIRATCELIRQIRNGAEQITAILQSIRAELSKAEADLTT